MYVYIYICIYYSTVPRNNNNKIKILVSIYFSFLFLFPTLAKHLFSMPIKVLWTVLNWPVYRVHMTTCRAISGTCDDSSATLDTVQAKPSAATAEPHYTQNNYQLLQAFRGTVL